MRERIIRTATLIVVLVATSLFASTAPAHASAGGAVGGRAAAINASSSANCPQPPNDVDHATFTSAQLAQYGLRPRTTGETLSHWQTWVRAAKHRFCKGTPTDHVSRWGPAAVHIAGTETGNGWAGYIATNWGYSYVYGEWHVPCLTLLLSNGVSNAWVGLGGNMDDGGGNIVQTGTESDEYQTWYGQWVANYYAWYAFGPNPTTTNAFGVNCGDSIAADVSQDGVTATMYLTDANNGGYISYPTSELSNGSTAEWIVERPKVNGSWPALSDFHYVNFTNDYADQNGSWPYINGLPNNQFFMYSNNWSQELAGPGGLGGSGAFTVTYYHHGP